MQQFDSKKLMAKKGIPKSMFGVHPKMKKFKKQENDFHEI